jgi:hypothetical protein
MKTMLALLLWTALQDPPSEYDKAFDEALLLAAARDYAGALAALDRADGPAKAEDQKAIGRARDMYLKAIENLKNLAPGTAVSLKYPSPAGRVLEAKGPLLRALRSRAEIKGSKESIFVEYDEIESEVLVGLYRDHTPKDKRDSGLMAHFFLFDGDPGRAKKLVKESEIPERLWKASAALEAKLKELRKNLSKEDAKWEQTARDSFYAAERKVRDPATWSEATAAYKHLIDNLANTAFVKKNKSFMETRLAQAGKQWVFAAQEIPTLSGGFKLEPAPDGAGRRILVCPKATLVKDEQGKKSNFFEFSFAAPGGVEVAVYVYLLACCQEAATLTYQGNELKGDNKGTKTNAEPGDRFYLKTVAPKEIPAAHSHAAGQGKWMWIRVHSQAFSAGAKKFRILTDFGDLSVRTVVVSSLKPRLPDTLEGVRALEEDR